VSSTLRKSVIMGSSSMVKIFNGIPVPGLSPFQVFIFSRIPGAGRKFET
jgi:hypothetical protein